MAKKQSTAQRRRAAAKLPASAVATDEPTDHQAIAAEEIVAGATDEMVEAAIEGQVAQDERDAATGPEAVAELMMTDPAFAEQREAFAARAEAEATDEATVEQVRDLEQQMATAAATVEEQLAANVAEQDEPGSVVEVTVDELRELARQSDDEAAVADKNTRHAVMYEGAEPPPAGLAPTDWLVPGQCTKRPGTDAWRSFQCYGTGCTVADYLANPGHSSRRKARESLRWDVARGLVRVGVAPATH